MQPSVALAQAATWREQAIDWDRAAHNGLPGCGEVALMLHRAARAAERSIGVSSEPEPPELPEPRAGMLRDEADTAARAA